MTLSSCSGGLNIEHRWARNHQPSTHVVPSKHCSFMAYHLHQGPEEKLRISSAFKNPTRQFV